MASWAYVPSDIFIKVLQYLSTDDRHTCGHVCRAWEQIVQDPQAWNYLIIQLDTDMDELYQLLSSVKYSSNITSLHIGWSMQLAVTHRFKYRVSSMARKTGQYLMLLKQQEITLAAVKLSDLCASWKFRKVLNHLSMFLRQQTRLKILDFSNAFLHRNDLFKILHACRHSGGTVKHLNLLSSFRQWNTVTQSAQFQNSMRSFSKLETLKVDYATLSDAVVPLLVKNSTGTLRLMEICIAGTNSPPHDIKWADIVNRCQHLRVILHIYNICHHKHLKEFLPRAMPLQSLTLRCGNTWDQHKTRKYCKTFKLLALHYAPTLTHLSVYLRNNRENVDKSLLDLIMKCPHLQYLEFDGVINSVDFLRYICNLQCHYNQRHFKFFHVRPKSTSIHNILALSELWRSYVKPIARKNFYFEIEAFSSTPVQIYV